MGRYFEPADPEKHAADGITNDTARDVTVVPENSHVDHSQSTTRVS